MKLIEPMVRQFADLDALSTAAAAEFCRIAGDAVGVRECCTVALAGGNTPRRLYEMLALPSYRSRVPWDRLEFFWGDERMVPPEDPESNYRMAHEALLSKVPVRRERIHRMPTDTGDPNALVRQYEEEIAFVFGIAVGRAIPVFDLIILGMGTDGHTASLFPGSPALVATEHWAVSSRAPKPPHDRVTLTLPVLNAARHVVFLVAGADKAATLAQVLEGPADPARLPAQAVAPANGTLTWLVDTAAASQLSQTGLSGEIRV